MHICTYTQKYAPASVLPHSHLQGGACPAQIALWQGPSTALHLLGGDQGPAATQGDSTRLWSTHGDAHPWCDGDAHPWCEGDAHPWCDDDAHPWCDGDAHPWCDDDTHPWCDVDTHSWCDGDTHPW